MQLMPGDLGLLLLSVLHSGLSAVGDAAALETVTVRLSAATLTPLLLRAVAEIVCGPLGKLVVFKL